MVQILQKRVSSSDFLYDTLDTTDTSVTDESNLIEKSRYPNYDLVYLAIYSFTNSSDLKDKIRYYIQNLSLFEYEDDNNIVDDRITVIKFEYHTWRNNLDIIHLSSYRNSSALYHTIVQLLDYN